MITNRLTQKEGEVPTHYYLHLSHTLQSQHVTCNSMWLVITCGSSCLTFQGSIKSESSNRSQFSVIISYREFSPVSAVQFSLIKLFTASQTSSNSTLSSTTAKSEGESPSKFSIKPGIRKSTILIGWTTNFRSDWNYLNVCKWGLKYSHPIYWTHFITDQFPSQGNY